MVDSFHWQTKESHPLSCSVRKDAVCDCDKVNTVAHLTWGDWVQVRGAADHNLDHDYGDDDVEASDTDRPPAGKTILGRQCYFCGNPAEHIVHVDMPACDSCKRRAVGRRSK